MIAFGIGLVIGGVLGIITSAAVIMAGFGDREVVAERLRREMRRRWADDWRRISEHVGRKEAVN